MPPSRPTRVLLFTDTLGDVNGVSRFVRSLAAEAEAARCDLRILTSTRFPVPEAPNIINLPPRFSRPMPGYPDLDLAIPPARLLRARVREFRPDVIHISTPGPIGLVGRSAARSLRVPLVGVYHTDFPAYIDHIFGHESLTFFTGLFMRRFYRPFAALLARSDDYARRLADLGVPIIERLRPGVRLADFSPEYRDHAPRPLRILYTGRLSIEKNLPFLARTWREADARLASRGIDAQLCLAGDGPYRAALARDLQGTRHRFLGMLHGVELAAAYASADLFVFPSTTDTLGQVVLEAQASGLPVLVSDRGGPREVVDPGRTGEVLRADDPALWVDRITALAADPPRRREMAAAAAAWARRFDFAASFGHWWSVHERVAREAALRGAAR